VKIEEKNIPIAIYGFMDDGPFAKVIVDREKNPGIKECT